MDRITLELQNKLLPIFNWFHNYCVNNHLRYYALGGTMLGAARHQGFIPWDDDIDVGMPREDYDVLVKCLGDKQIEHYYLETPYTKSFEYRYPYSKLYDINTTLIEHTWPNLKRGAFIDVFPLDGFGSTKDECVNHWNHIMRKSHFIWARTCAVRKERSLYKNMAIIAAHMLPNSIARDKYFLAEMNNECYKYSFDKSQLGGNTFGNWGLKEIMERSIMGVPTLYKFENLNIYGPEHYDSYLSHMYGKWEQLPPKEKQFSHHDFVLIDLNHSFME